MHIAVDGGEAQIVTAIETTPGGVAECHVLPDLVGKHVWNSRSCPAEAVADRAYGTREVYRFLECMGILAMVPRRRTYVCPAGKALYRTKERPNGSVV